MAGTATARSPRTRVPASPTPWSSSPLRRLPSVRLGLAQGAVVILVLCCRMLGVGAPLTLVLVSGITVACAVGLPTGFGLALGLVAWAWFTGFVANSYGLLTFTGPDLVRLALLSCCGAAAHWIRWMIR